jgi:uncharacterized protein YdeI (YjbR/CyaY-like superfamily)
MFNTNPKVDFFFNKATTWKQEIQKMRAIVLACPLTEELKWGVPCYTFQNGNVVIIHTFKEYCAFLMIKGVLLKDPHGILIQQTENVQSARQIRFTNLQEIIDQEPILREYILEAIEVEKSGQKVVFKKATEFPIADEFQKHLEENADLNEAFYALTPGRQRAYLLYFSAAKQPKTREARVEASIPHILNGKGLND